MSFMDSIKKLKEYSDSILPRKIVTVGGVKFLLEALNTREDLFFRKQTEKLRDSESTILSLITYRAIILALAVKSIDTINFGLYHPDEIVEIEGTKKDRFTWVFEIISDLDPNITEYLYDEIVALVGDATDKVKISLKSEEISTPPKEPTRDDRELSE